MFQHLFCFIQNPQSDEELNFIFIPYHMKTLHFHKEEKENLWSKALRLLAHQGTERMTELDCHGGKLSRGLGSFQNPNRSLGKSSGIYSSWSDSLQHRQCWLHLRRMRSRKGVGPFSFCLAYPTPLSVPCRPVLTPSVNHMVSKMLCIQKWIKVSAMNRQLQISKIKKKAQLASKKKGSPMKDQKEIRHS